MAEVVDENICSVCARCPALTSSTNWPADPVGVKRDHLQGNIWKKEACSNPDMQASRALSAKT